MERLHYYQRLLGLPADPNAPDDLPLDWSKLELTEENFDETYGALVGQYDKALTLQTLPDLEIAADSTSGGLGGLFSGFGIGASVSEHERGYGAQQAIATSERSLALQLRSINSIASVLTFIPDMDVNLAFLGARSRSRGFSVDRRCQMLVKIGAGIMSNDATSHQEQAGMASRTASYQRRADDWMLQYNLAAHELMQIGRQILTSLIAEQIAHHEYLNIQKQIENAQEVDQFLHDKFTNEDLYLLDAGRDFAALLRVLPLRVRHRAQGGEDHEAGTDAPRSWTPRTSSSSTIGTAGARGCSPARRSIWTSSGWRWPITTTTSASWS